MFKGPKLSTLKRSTSAVAVASAIAIGFSGLAIAQVAKGDTFTGNLAAGDEQPLRIRWAQMATVHFGIIAFATVAMEINLGVS